MNNIQWAVHVACMGQKCIQDFGRNALRKETNRKTQMQKGQTIKMDIIEIRREGINWINLTQDGDTADSSENNAPSAS
jgi:hypothetical protein